MSRTVNSAFVLRKHCCSSNNTLISDWRIQSAQLRTSPLKSAAIIKMQQAQSRIPEKTTDNKSMRPQSILEETFYRILTRPSADNAGKILSQGKINFLVHELIKVDRHKLSISQQISSVLTNISQRKENLFDHFETEWVMNWMLEHYYPHLNMISEFEKEYIIEQAMRRDRDSVSEVKGDDIELTIVIDLPTISQPLRAAREIYDGAKTIVCSDDQEEENKNDHEETDRDGQQTPPKQSSGIQDIAE